MLAPNLTVCRDTHSEDHSWLNLAVYLDQTIAGYQGNPLIEALPPINNFKTASELMSNLPKFSVNDLDLPPELRVHCVDTLQEIIYPLPEALSLESAFSRLIRTGYKAHNPLMPSTWRHRYLLYQNKAPEKPVNNFATSASCLMVCGLSGMGKSTMIKSILNLYSQVIHHREYNSTKLCFTQIVWLKISIPQDGLLSGICLEFFAAVDRILGTDFLDQHKRMKIDLMLKKMEEIACNYFIGTIVIDELQNLNLAKSGGAKKVLSYFRSLMENVGVPLVLIGTYAATDLFCSGLQDPRRATEAGIIDVIRPNATDIHWNNFLDIIQQYQWIGNDPCEFSKTIRDKIHELTQGITDFAIRLVMLAQISAIRENQPKLTTKLLERTMEKHFRLILPALQALKSGKARHMAQFDDLMHPRLKQLRENDLLNEATPVHTSPKNETGSTEANDTSPNIHSEPAQTGKIVSGKPYTEKNQLERKKPPAETDSDAEDLRNISPNMTPYEAIKAQGLIANLESNNFGSVKSVLTVGRKF